MRKMKNEFGSVNVKEHWMTRNFWEYYITDEDFDEDIVRAVILGDETDIGDISKSEILPFVISKTKKLNGIMPAPGWSWVEV